MPNYVNKKTGELKRFPSVRITWNEDMTQTTETCLITGEVISDNHDFLPLDGEYNVKMKRAQNDGHGLR